MTNLMTQNLNFNHRKDMRDLLISNCVCIYVILMLLKMCFGIATVYLFIILVFWKQECQHE